MLHTDLQLAPARVDVERRADGTLVLRSPMPLGPCARCAGEWLVAWARRTPERVFLAERNTQGGWRLVSYGEALDAVVRIGASLLARGLGPERPIAILSDNGVDHALVMLGAMHVGVPVAPVSPAYSLLSKDFAKLRGIFELVEPGLVFVDDGAGMKGASPFAPALEAVGARATPLSALLDDAGEPARRRVDAAFAAVGPDTVAKILFTSGSTGAPKGVTNTQRMLCASQEGLAAGWPFLESRPPVVVDWLPWSHTFGGNHNFNLVLRNGGTLYVDGGKPAPGLIERTVRNLTEVSPTAYFNVPRGFDLLLPHLETDAALRASFFRELDVVFYAAAALPPNLWARLEALAHAERGGRLAMFSAWGATETSPLATQVHFAIDRAGVIGLPIAGCELKLVPSAGKLEARVRGPNVTPGYVKRPDLTRAAFDEEGFYRTGDAMKLADPDRPERGVVFDGRVAEDFKLTTGTWVHVGALRTRLIAAADPFVQDAVITGHDRDEVGALLFLTAQARAQPPATVAARLAEALAALAEDPGGSSMRVGRALVLDEPASLDDGEITDKGYLNQRAILERRALRVADLYRGGDRVIVVRGARNGVR
ncbi:MAG TPA: feruloyl-CoA synthase [Polyangiaceae bacterium]|jgi:feruloyl-CoA synthase